MPIDAIRTRNAVLTGLLWFLVALAAGASGALQQLRPPAPQLVLVGLTGALVVAGVASPRFRAWAFSLDLRGVVALHLTRFVGAAFLVYYRRGELPFAFAVPGGWGDIAVATAAILVLASGAPSTPGRRAVYGVWNMFGLADLLFVVFTAARLAFADPDSMRALLRLPLSLLPTFLVPILIASHVLIAARLMSASRPSVDTRGGNA